MFWIDRLRKLEITYLDLLNKINQQSSNNVFIREENPYLVFLNILKNFLSGQRSIILDYDFSEDELYNLGITNTTIKESEYIQEDFSKKFHSIQEIIFYLKTNKKKIELDIYTSGTTGRPKKITQSFENLTRGVKEQSIHKDNIWGFAYNPTHFAGLQVFFQAFFNTNTLVYIFGNDFKRISLDLKVLQVSHLSCTPTFFKMLLPHVEGNMNSIVSLTFGGEKFDPKIEKFIIKKFPNAVIKNVYASTEAGSLFRSDGEYFIIPEKYVKLIKIENLELYIHKELLGKSKSFKLVGQWYKTGDIVELYDGGKFKFKNRKSEMINVGGYKVNPSEVEDIIKTIKGVADVIVFGRKNSLMGEIVVAHIVKESSQNAKDLKEKIKQITSLELQEFKVPRLIKFVDSFELTRTGKIKK
jgi:acyl-CoA synthetase (AMP-forming)/AMP-acid ligase II